MTCGLSAPVLVGMAGAAAGGMTFDDFLGEQVEQLATAVALANGCSPERAKNVGEVSRFEGATVVPRWI